MEIQYINHVIVSSGKKIQNVEIHGEPWNSERSYVQFHRGKQVTAKGYKMKSVTE